MLASGIKRLGIKVEGDVLAFSAGSWSRHGRLCRCLCFYLGNNAEQIKLVGIGFYAHKNGVARPRTNPEKHRKNVAITLDPDLLLQTRALAAAKGRSLSQLLDDLLRAWLSQQEPTDEELENAIMTFIEAHEQRETPKDSKKRLVKK